MTVPRVAFRFIIVLLLLLGGLLHLLPAQAQDHSTEDIIRQVKAAYLFKFGNYVLWPAQTFASDQSPIVIIGHETTQPVSSLLAPLRGEPVLGVTEEDRGLMPGGIINFVLDNNRIRFDVSLAAAEQNHLQLSAALLSVARKVEKSDVE